MRKDQKEIISSVTKDKVEAVLVAALLSVGVKSLSDILPNSDKFISDLIDVAYAETFSDEELDEVIAFNLKYKEKQSLIEMRSQKYIDKYFKKNEKVIEAMVDLLK